MLRFISLLTSLVFLAACTAITQAQIVWSEPLFPTQSEAITLFYDANEGNGVVANVIPVYVHTGVITSESDGPSDWLHVQTSWGTSDPEAVMNPLGGGVHSFDFGGQTLEDYYGVAEGEMIEALAFVFRNGDGSLVGRNADGSDIFYELTDGGYSVSIMNPVEGLALMEIGESLEVNGIASELGTLSIVINGDEVATTEGLEINYTFDATETGQFVLELAGSNGVESDADQASILVLPEEPIQAWAPEGTEDGITYLSDNAVRLQLFAPMKEFVFVVGDFNGWELGFDYMMNQTPDGSRYWLDIEGLTPGESYGFHYHIMPDDIRVTDPYAELVLDPWNDGWISNETYPDPLPFPSMLTSNEPVGVLHPGAPDFAWTDDEFERPVHEDLVIYELLVRDFTEERNFQTILDTLDYLDRLGINAIEFMPIMEFNGNDSWGYNTTFYMALDKAYGTKTHFQSLVDACHARGIAVILDIVLNHSDQPNPMLKMYWDPEANLPTGNNPWFNVYAPHAMNWFYDWNHESAGTKSFTKRVLKYWIDMYHVDGYRLDFSQGMSQTEGGNGSYDQSRIDILTAYGSDLWETYPGRYMFLEHWSEMSEEQALVDAGFMMWTNVASNYQEASMGYSSDFSWASSASHGFSWPAAMGYASSHDEEQLMYKCLEYGNSAGGYNVSNLETALSRMEAIQSFNVLVPGPRLIWQFEELGYDYSINTCSDGVTVNEGCRTDAKPIRWDYRLVPERYRIHKVIAGLAALKTQYPGTFRLTNYNFDVWGYGKRLILDGNDMDAVVTANFDVTGLNITPGFTHTGTWYDYFSGESFEVIDLASTHYFAPGEYHVFLDQPVAAPYLVDDVLEASFTSAPILTASPNPVMSGTSAFLLSGLPNGQHDIVLLDASGRSIWRQQVASTGEDVSLSLQSMSPGLYYIKAISSRGKILVTRLSLL
jgi:hypothetical protein